MSSFHFKLIFFLTMVFTLSTLIAEGNNLNQDEADQLVDSNLFYPKDLVDRYDIFQSQHTTYLQDYSVSTLSVKSQLRLSYPRLLRDQKSKRTFLLLHSPSNYPVDDGLRTPEDCTEGIRTLRLMENMSKTGVHNFKNVSVVAADCGYRVENGDLFIHERKIYLPYILIGKKDQCFFPDDLDPSQPTVVSSGVGGRKWQVKLKVSTNIDEGAITFSGLKQGNSYEVLQETCVHNSVKLSTDGKGTAEPYIYKIENNIIDVVYADEYTANQKSCGQVIRQLKFSVNENKTIYDEEVGHCPGQRRRDGMSVVAYNSYKHEYMMVFESLKKDDDQIVMVSSVDGDNWSDRRVIVSLEDVDAENLGIPYIKYYKGYTFISFVAIYSDHTEMVVKILDKNGNEYKYLDQGPYFTITKHELINGASKDLLWGNIDIFDDLLYATTAALAGSDLTVSNLNIKDIIPGIGLANDVRISWKGYEDNRRCSLDIWDGENRVACTTSSQVGWGKSFLFKGYCNRNNKNYKISEITKFRMNCALNADFSDPENIIAGESSYDGKKPSVEMIVESKKTTTEVQLSWTGYEDNRRCSLDIWDGENRVACTPSITVGWGKSFLFKGYCNRNNKNYEISEITKFRMNCALNADFSDPENIIAGEVSYDGEKPSVEMIVESKKTTTEVQLSWTGYEDNRRCSLDIWDGENRVACIPSVTVGWGKSYLFKGYCNRNNKNYEISRITKFRMNCALNADFSDPENIIAGEASYDGKKPSVEMIVESKKTTEVQLSWTGYEDKRRCSLDIWDGENRVACTPSITVGWGKSFLFKGYCNRNNKNYEISEITKFRMNCALNADFRDPENVIAGETSYDGKKTSVEMIVE